MRTLFTNIRILIIKQIMFIYIKTRMITFLKMRFKKSDDQTNINKDRVDNWGKRKIELSTVLSVL